MAATPEVLVDRYEVGPLLGSGGMAEVFEGHDRLLARRVAIKVLLPQHARDPAFQTRFKREAQSAASLTHPNIVGIFDTGQQAGTNFIVMEYVEGRTLRDILHEEGPLLPRRAAEVAADVCSALAAAHARGVIHRDIKPGNIMCTPEGQIKVMDFGIARAQSAESITQTAAVVGTAQYISPEQAQAAGVDARSDLYSLGCCLYEMLTGQVPFSGQTPVAIAYRHVQENPVPPSQINPDVPPTLEAVTIKAMAKNPENRYQTAIEMREDLERALAGRPVLATPLLDMSTHEMLPQPAGEPTAFIDRMTTGAGSEALPRAAPSRRGAGWLALLGLLVVAGLAALFVARSLSSGTTAKVTIPTLRGDSIDQARSQLQSEGLTVGDVPQRRSDPTIPKNLVIGTIPAAGQSVDKNSQVTLVVSTGPPVVATTTTGSTTTSSTTTTVRPTTTAPPTTRPPTTTAAPPTTTAAPPTTSSPPPTTTAPPTTT